MTAAEHRYGKIVPSKDCANPSNQWEKGKGKRKSVPPIELEENPPGRTTREELLGTEPLKKKKKGRGEGPTGETQGNQPSGTMGSGTMGSGTKGTPTQLFGEARGTPIVPITGEREPLVLSGEYQGYQGDTHCSDHRSTVVVRCWPAKNSRSVAS